MVEAGGFRFHCHCHVLIAAWLLSAGLVLAAEFDYTVEVAAGRLNCYYVPITDPKHVKIELDYQVIDGGDLDVNFYARSPDGVVLASDTRSMEQTHHIELKGKLGDYELCWDNTFSYQASKTVFFEVLLLDAKGNYDDLDSLDKLASSPLAAEVFERGRETLDQVKGASVRLKGALNKAEHYQSLVRAAEARDRAVMEANFTRVNFWSIVHLFVMMGVAGTQLYLIRVLFDDESKVGKFIRQGKVD